MMDVNVSDATVWRLTLLVFAMSCICIVCFVGSNLVPCVCYFHRLCTISVDADIFLLSAGGVGPGGDGASLLIDLGAAGGGGARPGGSSTPPLPAVATAPAGPTDPTGTGSLLDIRDIPGEWARLPAGHQGHTR